MQFAERLPLSRHPARPRIRYSWEHKEEKGDEPTKEKDEPPERICPCCEEGVMKSVAQFPRPTVHEIMQMSLDQLRQPTLPFL